MKTQSDKPLGLRERKKRDAAARMREAAAELMFKYGYENVTTKEIAHHADVGEATLFRYFSTKRDLFLTIYSERFEDVINACEPDLVGSHITEKSDFIGLIQTSYRRFADLYVEYPELAYAYTRASYEDTIAPGHDGLAFAERWYRLLEAFVCQGQTTGALVDGDPSVLVQNCHALYVHEVLRSHGRQLSTAEMPDRLRTRLAMLLSAVTR